MTTKIKRDIYQEVTDKVLDMMKTCGSNWTNPMTKNNKGWAFNAVTKQRYQGVNVLMLGTAGGGAFASYKQWQDKGCQVIKGSKGHQIIFYKKMTVTDQKTEEVKSIPMIRSYTVFSADQVEGEFANQYKQVIDNKDEFEQIEAVTNWVEQSGAQINTLNEARACYYPSQDYIQMPPRSGFKATSTSTASENYHSTLLHELTHWTGHKSRLDRNLKGKFGEKDYAYEELVAELGSAFQCVKLGVSNQPREDHAKYLNNWIEALSNDKKMIVKASSMAQQAVDYIEGLATAEIREVA